MSRVIGGYGVMFLQEMVFAGVTPSEVGETSQDFLRSEAWRKIVTQVESALCREDRSRQALDQLQQLATEQGTSTQFLLKSVIRETIRLTLDCCGISPEWLKRADLATVTIGCIDSKTDSSVTENVKTESLKTEHLKAESLKIEAGFSPTESGTESQLAEIARTSAWEVKQQKEVQEDAAIFTAIGHVLQPYKPQKIRQRKLGLKQQQSETNVPVQLSSEAQAQQDLDVRQAQFLALGSVIHQYRTQKELSLQEVHAQTFIPLSHLQSLEAGKCDRLPEEVYVRGFLRRLEQCFHLTSGQLTDHLPAGPQGFRTCAPSSTTKSISRSPQGQGYDSPFIHAPALNYAYIAYAALMAGGVCWIAQQGSPKSNLPPIQIDTPHTPMSESKMSGSNQLSRQATDQSVTLAQSLLSRNIAAPESLA